MIILKKKIINLFNYTFLSIPIFGILLFLIIFLLSTHSWIFNQNIFFGQNWDHQLTDNELLSKNFFYNSLYIWHDNYGNNTLSTTQILTNFSIFLFKYFYSAILTNKLFLFFIIFFGFIINYKTLYFDCNSTNYRKINSILFSIFYCFSPYFFNLIIAGSIYSWVSYLLFPTYIVYFYKYLELNLKKKIYFYLISFFFIGFLQYYILANFFLLFYFFYYNKFKKETLLIFVKIYLYQLVINLYWILPSLNSFSDLTSKLDNFPFFDYTFKKQSFFDVITMSGFLDRNFSLLSLNYIKLSIFIFVSILVFINLVKNIISTKTKYKFNLFLLILLLISIFLAKKYNPPFGEFYYLINQLLWFISPIFRSDQNLFILVFFIYFFLNFKNSSYNFFQGFLFIILIILLHSSGDYGSNILKSKLSSHIAFTEKRYEFNKMLDDINNNINGKFLIFPSTNSPNFYSKNGSYVGQGSIFEYNLFDNASTIFLDFNKKIIALKELSHENILLNNIQAFYLVKKDIKYHHTPSFKDYIDNLDTNYSKIYNKTFENDFYIKFETGSSSLYFYDYDKQNSKILDKFEIRKINKILYISELINNYNFTELIFYQNFSKNWCVFIYSDILDFLSFKTVTSNFKCSKPFLTKLNNINSFKIKDVTKTDFKFKIYFFNINQFLFYFSILIETIILFILFRRKKNI